MIYFDNAATSYPKPEEVLAAIIDFTNNIGGSPGRSGHRLSIESGRILYQCRENLAELFNVADPLRIIFTLNATEAINLVLKGLLHRGDHVITSSMEHNAIMRPLNELRQKDVRFTKIACNADGSLDPALIESAIQPNTRLIALNHASNVCGTVLPVKEVGQIVRNHDLLFLVDTAQTAGVIPIDMEEASIDLLAFTGHKSLYGPMGTGGLIIGQRIDPEELQPVRQGGTGSRSEQVVQPTFLPDRYESGTPNAVGLAGLLAALTWLKSEGIETIRAHEKALTAVLLEGLGEIAGVELYGTQDASKQIATVAFNIRGLEPSTIGLRLDEEFNILSRVGLHCAPTAHQTLGTFPQGSVRFGLGAFNQPEDVCAALNAVRLLAKEAV